MSLLVPRQGLAPMASTLARANWLNRSCGGCKIGGTAVRSASQAPSAGDQSGFIEIREYTLKPEGMKDFIGISTKKAAIRSQLLPFLGMFTCDVGGVLSKVTHLYSYKNFESRDAIRSAAQQNPDWGQYVDEARVHVAHQENKVMQEAHAVYAACGVAPAATFKSPAAATSAQVVYELRNYQLHPGYGSVPKLIDAFSKGLPHKMKVDKEGRLVMMAYSDVGLLNNVIELWRYPSAQACMQARQSARTVLEWREAVSQVTPFVQHFQTTLLRPTSFSPWQ